MQEQLMRFYVEPDIAVNVTARHSETASVIGAVGAPGVRQIHDQITLLDAALSLAGLSRFCTRGRSVWPKPVSHT